MRQRRVGIKSAGLAVLAAAVVVTVGIPAGYFLVVYGCGEKEDRLAAAIAGDPVLDAGPAGAGQGRPYKGCDDDDLWVYAGNSYSYGGSRESALVHYRDAAQANGWRPRDSASAASGSDCFTKRIGGTTAYLDVEDAGDGSVLVEIVADRTGSDWC
ncbi:hypothetical protein [Streptomyces sp. NPDC050704]|uniref:hypothetical protein n=1 Tax=Streptomyces sp. NPDC050704 TaxID=3157219 RepID=UPI00342D0F2A